MRYTSLQYGHLSRPSRDHPDHLGSASWITDADGNGYTSLQYFYHPDHLGSASWITDADGNGYQHLQYLPPDSYRDGESWVEQRLGSYNTPYQFSGKEKDEETGYNYFGARYYDSDLSVWLSVDPMSDKYPSFSTYCYVTNNPIMLFDPDGKWIPGLDDDGTVTYTAERGDTYKTFMDQYDLTSEQASKILNPQSKIVAGETQITGDDVKAVMGTDVLRLNLQSKATTDHDINLHTAFMINNETKNQKRTGGIADLDNYFTEWRGHTSHGQSHGLNTNPATPTEVTLYGERVSIHVNFKGGCDGRFQVDMVNTKQGPKYWKYEYYHPNAYNKKKPEMEIPVIAIFGH